MVSPFDSVQRKRKLGVDSGRQNGITKSGRQTFRTKRLSEVFSRKS